MTRARPGKWTSLNKIYCYNDVQHFEHRRECSHSGITKIVICKRKRQRRFVLFIIMCPKLWHPVTALDLSLQKLWSERKQWQEMHRGNNQHTLQKYRLGWQEELLLHWTSHCQGGLGVGAKVLDYKKHGKMPSIVKKYSCSLLYKNLGNKLLIKKAPPPYLNNNINNKITKK